MEQVAKYLPTSASSLLAFDYETTGLTIDDEIVGVSFTDAAHPAGVYFSFKHCGRSVNKAVLDRIASRPSIAHNAQFEQWMTFSSLAKYANIQYDTAALLNQIEGDWAAQYGKGLKNAQTMLLGWENAGDVELDEWLTANGYTNARGKVLKGEMHNTPDTILGRYCNYDSQSTWDLYTKVFAPILERFPELDVYHTRDFQNLIKLIDKGRRNGLTVDRPKLQTYSNDLQTRLDNLMDRFYSDSPATPFIKEYNRAQRNVIWDKMPSAFTKTGKPSSRYEKWELRMEKANNTNHFNANSKKQLAWLFYDCLYDTEHKEVRKRHKIFWQTTIKGVGKVEGTKGGARAVDKKILPKLGEAGEILAEYNKLNKEKQYVDKMLERSTDGKHYTQLRVSGTKTDRCAGTGGLNIQQLPKSQGYLECLTPREGSTFIQMDVDALEPVVLAELSGCSSYMSLYGPNAAPNDVYLFIASKIPQFAKEIRDAGYNPDNPTREGIASTKKKCKRIRTICKLIHLAAGYGAGTDKIHASLNEQGVDITFKEVEDIRSMYWKVFNGVVKYRDRLTRSWKANRGFFLDGLGTPVTVDGDYEKDILNRCIQRTGHMILAKYLYHLSQINPPAAPVVVDFHDETIWECEKGTEKETLAAFNEAWTRTNAELGGIIPLSGTPEEHKSFWGFKGE